jgi:hypothetical protein
MCECPVINSAGLAAAISFTNLTPHLVPIDIAAHRAERLESLKPLEDARSEIARVPDLIAVRKILEDRLVEKAVRVGHQANAHALAS